MQDDMDIAILPLQRSGRYLSVRRKAPCGGCSNSFIANIGHSWLLIKVQVVIRMQGAFFTLWI